MKFFRQKKIASSLSLHIILWLKNVLKYLKKFKSHIYMKEDLHFDPTHALMPRYSKQRSFTERILGIWRVPKIARLVPETKVALLT